MNEGSNEPPSRNGMVDSMYPGDQPLYEALFRAEDRHFWFTARNSIIAAAVDRARRSFPEGYRVLEVGCGTGNVLRVLESNANSGSSFGMDLFAGGLAYARMRTHSFLLQGDMYHPPFRITFDLIGMFDVIEHLADDVAALRSVRNLISPGGKLVVTTPAHMSLWSYADEFAGHYRRYEPKELAAALWSAGLDVEYLTPFFIAIVPLLWFKRRFLVSRRLKQGTKIPRELFLKELQSPPLINGTLRWMLQKEAKLIRSGVELPFGSSLLAIATKRANFEPCLTQL